MYMYHFFKTEREAKVFQKKQGFGMLYKNVPGSRTKRNYITEAQMAQKTQAFIAEYPYVVVWNEID